MSLLAPLRPPAASRAVPPAQAAWPFAPSRSFAQGLQRLMAAVAGLPLLGWEASCKLSPGQVSSNRLLLGLATAAVAPARLRALPEALGMPAVLAAGWLQELPSAQRVLLALEQGGQGLEIKAYLEWRGASNAPSPALAMRGRKWRPHAQLGAQPAAPPGALALRTSDYFQPALAPSALRALLAERQAQDPALAPAWAVMAQALDLAAPLGGCDWLSVSELPSPRASGCLRPHGSGLRLGQLSALQRLARAWALDPDALMRLPGERQLTWLAAGQDGHTQPFLTLYSEASLTDARQVLALGAFDAHA